MSLVDSLINSGYLVTPSIIEAFKKIDRINFVSEEAKSIAYLNEALPIGEGQTISQPAVVAFMLELLQPQAGDKVLDIGAGSGWTTALLACIVTREEASQSEKGKVTALEVIPELVDFGKENVKKYNYIEKGVVDFVCADGRKGFQEEAPFDRILVSASAEDKCPEELKKQLRKGGRIVIPLGGSIWLLQKQEEGKFKEWEFPGFAFVPLK